MKYIGILGGTFDPIHNGHLAIADAAYEALGFDEIRLMPAGNPPHKRGLAITDSADRLEMVKLAAKARPYLKVEELELWSLRPSYTVETFPLLQKTYPDMKFRMIIGGDSLPDLKKWYRGEELLRTVPFAVCTRAGFSDEGLLHTAKEYELCYGADIQWFTAEPPEVSSTQIRGLVQDGQEIDRLVPEGVAQYIKTHHLYGKEQ